MKQARDYTPAIAALLAQKRLNPLGPGTANLASQPDLRALTLDAAFAPHVVRDRNMAMCCLSALWLYHDYLDESHMLSQEIETATGSYWHGIMHRREPDYANAKYWFRRVGSHAIFPDLQQSAAELARGGAAPCLASQQRWDPFAFIDLCERARPGGDEELCRKIQACEWELLFDYCYRHAL